MKHKLISGNSWTGFGNHPINLLGLPQEDAPAQTFELKRSFAPSITAPGRWGAEKLQQKGILERPRTIFGMLSGIRMHSCMHVSQDRSSIIPKVHLCISSSTFSDFLLFNGLQRKCTTKGSCVYVTQEVLLFLGPYEQLIHRTSHQMGLAHTITVAAPVLRYMHICLTATLSGVGAAHRVG